MTEEVTLKLRVGFDGGEVELLDKAEQEALYHVDSAAWGEYAAAHHDWKRTADEYASTAKWLAEDLNGDVYVLERHGRTRNSLGTVQGRGGALDRLAGLLEVYVNRLARVTVTARELLAPAVAHNARAVPTNDDKYVPACSCGWDSPARDNMTDAKVAVEKHLAAKEDK